MLIALLFVLGVVMWAYVWPPTRSATALRRRLDALEEEYATDHTELRRLVKRYRALEGHVYGSMEPDDEEIEAVGDRHNLGGAPGSPNLALLPDPDFPEEEFQRLVAERRAFRG